MKKALLVTLALLSITLFCYACDREREPRTGGCGDTNAVCTEDGGPVDGAIESKLYYPCNIREKVGATTVTGGFWEVLSDVEWLSQDIAEAGYVVLAFTVEDNTGWITGWKKSHIGAINRLMQINQDSSSKLYGKIDTNKLQTCGHSKGGGSSLWAAATDLRGVLKTAVGMAPWDETTIRFDIDYELSQITAATLIQAAALDSMAVPSMTRELYGNPMVTNYFTGEPTTQDIGLPDTISRAYFEYDGLGHAAWYKAFPKAGEMLSSNIIAWMKYYLDGDTSYQSQLADGSQCVKYEWIDKSN